MRPTHPFADSLPVKPQVARMADGRIAVYVGGAYQYLTEAQALSLSRQLEDAITTGVPA